jgi:diguanylate cyclase (GGDEF)-like protein/putative nucleotidyltransferase with HDIG domain
MNKIDLNELKEIAKKIKVLYVEDEEKLRESISKYFGKFFKSVECAVNGEDGLGTYINGDYDLVITDIMMPVMNGLEMAEKIKEINHSQNIMIISAYAEIEHFIKSIKIGIDGYILKPIDYNQLNEGLYKIVYKINESKENILYKTNLEKLVETKIKESKELQEEKIENYKQTIFALSNMIERRDTYTGGHSQRVAKYSSLIATEMGYNAEECDKIYQVGVLHDIGKTAIPDSILLKPSALNEREFNLIKQHAILGYEMVSKMPMYKDMALMVRSHHERLDGSGYPEGLKGDEIPKTAQIMAVADTFDAMTTSRIYKARKSIKKALEEIEFLKGKFFADDVVKAAVKVLSSISIDNEISQLPRNEIEQERFSYFYKDQVTDLYSKSYLSYVIFENSVEKKHNYISVVYIDNFYEYNKKYGWERGDKLLKRIADSLKQNYFKDTIIFRMRGVEFVILSKVKLHVDLETIKKRVLFDNFDIRLKSIDFNIKSKKIESISDLENQININETYKPMI